MQYAGLPSKSILRAVILRQMLEDIPELSLNLHYAFTVESFDNEMDRIILYVSIIGTGAVWLLPRLLCMQR